MLQATDARHEVRIEPARHDADEADARQQRNARVLAEFDETIFKSKPRQLRVLSRVQLSVPPIPSGTYSAAAISSDQRASSSATRSAGSQFFLSRSNASKCATPLFVVGSTIRHSLARR